MALLKSVSLELEELNRLVADECYAILEDWQSQGKPIIVPTVHAVPKKRPVDDKPFGYNYSHLPSRNHPRHTRWSEL